jgi:hypothetical protein
MARKSRATSTSARLNAEVEADWTREQAFIRRHFAAEIADSPTYAGAWKQRRKTFLLDCKTNTRALEAIAGRIFPSLLGSEWDRLDFREINRGVLHNMLDAAYAAGQQEAMAKVKPRKTSKTAPIDQRIAALAAESEPDAAAVLEEASTTILRLSTMLWDAIGLLDSPTIQSSAPGLEEAGYLVETREAARTFLTERGL